MKRRIFNKGKLSWYCIDRTNKKKWIVPWWAIQEAKKEVFDDLDDLIDPDHPLNEIYRQLKKKHLNTSNTESEKKKHYNIGLRSPMKKEGENGN